MRAPTVLLLIAAAALIPGQVPAMITTHRTEPVHSSSWAKGLDGIVNHPSRISGTVGPFGPTARFQYSGSLTNLNDVLMAYALVAQQNHILYLTPTIRSSDSGKPLDFELSINFNSEGFLHLNVKATTDLESIHIPPGVMVESLPPVSIPIGAELNQQQAAAQKLIETFLERHATSQISPVAQNGSIAPPLSGLSADGNAIDAAQPWPAHFTNKTVLVVFWSAQDPTSAGLMDRLKEIRKEFGDKANFQMVSFCVDAEWAPWMRWVSRRVDYAEFRLHDDPKWWQVIQDPNVPPTAARYGVGQLPSGFLIGPDRRIVASKIGLAELRKAVEAVKE